jgi:hypothetical protein
MAALTANLKNIATFVKMGAQFGDSAAKMSGEAANTMLVMAYFTRYYALERGLQLKQDAADNAFLETLFPLLDSAKSMLPAGGDDEHFKIVGEFVFGKFEDLMVTDTEGRATKDTAIGFFDCSNLFRVLTTFPKQIEANGISDDINSKLLLCIAKAKEIVRRTAGAPAAAPLSLEPLSLAPVVPAQAPLPMAPPLSPTPGPTTAPENFAPPNPASFAPPVNVTQEDLMAAQRDKKLSPAVSDAIEHLEFAIAHLRRNEVGPARTNINQALGNMSS